MMSASQLSSPALLHQRCWRGRDAEIKSDMLQESELLICGQNYVDLNNLISYLILTFSINSHYIALKQYRLFSLFSVMHLAETRVISV